VRRETGRREPGTELGAGAGVVEGLRHAIESEVVLAFLRGEMDSERFGSDVRQALVEAGGLDLVRRPDLGSEEENRARVHALSAARGWRTDTGLFAGFPETVEWYHGLLPPDELSRVRYINYSYWLELSGGSRLPRDVPSNLRAGTLPPWLRAVGTGWCLELAARLATAGVVDDLIVMATPDLSELVLLEGHARITAIFVGGLHRRVTVRGYLGLSPDIERWELF
jgi:hypothetical protein